MKPFHYQTQVYQNAAWQLTGTYKDPDGNVINLSGYEGELVVRKSVASPEALLRVDTASGNVLLTADAVNNVTVKLTATQTDELPTNNREIDDWVYELLIWDTQTPESSSVRLMEGIFRVSPSVARDDNT